MDDIAIWIHYAHGERVAALYGWFLQMVQRWFDSGTSLIWTPKMQAPAATKL